MKLIFRYEQKSEHFITCSFLGQKENKERDARQRLRWTRWRWYYCSILAPVVPRMLTHPANSQACVRTYTWVASEKQNISALENFSEGIESLPCIAYLFIYLIILCSPQGGSTHTHTVDMLHIHTVTYGMFPCVKELPSGSVGFLKPLSAPPEELEVECLTQGHLGTSC